MVLTINSYRFGNVNKASTIRCVSDVCAKQNDIFCTSISYCRIKTCYGSRIIFAFTTYFDVSCPRHNACTKRHERN